ncbi:hypothetical protein MKX01_003575 [Papaver californicum]|nr:hypothetical protein MKX01_003575 [Papaver californicum]
MARKEFFVLDTENCGNGGKMIEDKVLKQQSLGSLVSKRLSDITNSLSSPNQHEKQKLVGSCSEKDYIGQLLKENVALRKVIAERNAMAGIEIKKMRETMQKLQQQNWHLAQANSKMLMEVNIGKDRLKAMQHELGCRNAMVKSLQLQGREENEPCQKAHTEEIDKKTVGVKGRRQSRIHSVESSAAMDKVVMEDQAEVKGPSNSNRRRQSRIHSIESSAVTKEVVMEDKADDKRHSAVSKHEQTEANEEKADNKRPCLRRKSSAFFTPEVPEEPTDEKAEGKRVQQRRHSTRLKPQQPESAEDLCEMEDAKFPVSLLLDEPMKETGATSSDSTTVKEAKKISNAFLVETPEPRRASIGRPMRSAAVKVHSYKEVPLNIKMRRA